VVELKRALEVNPQNQRALSNVIYALEESGQRWEALPYHRRMAELDPGNPHHPFELANTLGSVGCAQEALFYGRKTLAIAPRYKTAASNYLLTLHYSDRETPEAVAREHFRLAPLWIKRPRRGPDAFQQPRAPDRKLRIGYVSSDLATHPVGKIVQPILAAHNKDSFEIYCYSSGKADDHWTKRIREAAGAFRDVREMNDDRVEQVVLEDRIDILVDLGGHTAGGNRLEVFASGAAPIQVSFLGYPSTTGLMSIDYRLTDAYCDPPGRTEHFHSESLIRLQHGFLCYRPPDNVPPIHPAPFAEAGYVTFGSFNNLAKLSPSVLRAWAEILRRVPESRLTFKYGGRFDSEWIRERIRGAFAVESVDPARLTFLPSIPAVAGHLEAIGKVDIALDPFPYQGTHTTLETLTMSVPVITLCGESYVRRASSALMMRLGLNDLVARTPDEYVNLAVELAGNPSLLRELRLGLRARFFGSEICDVPGFVAELETTYRRLRME
jgi:predicted O-linked N-acetylglucosamine transferase (SPINDLY family)